MDFLIIYFRLFPKYLSGISIFHKLLILFSSDFLTYLGLGFIVYVRNFFFKFWWVMAILFCLFKKQIHAHSDLLLNISLAGGQLLKRKQIMVIYPFMTDQQTVIY